MYVKQQDVCFGCLCFNLVGSYCNLTDTVNEKPCDTVLEDCPLPLATLPKVHGNLIDVEDLKALLISMWSQPDKYSIADVFREIPDIPVIVKENS